MSGRETCPVAVSKEPLAKQRWSSTAFNWAARIAVGYGVKVFRFFSPRRLLRGQDSQGHETRRYSDRTAARFKSVVNLKIAKMLGIDIPTSILLRAMRCSS